MYGTLLLMNNLWKGSCPSSCISEKECSNTIVWMKHEGPHIKDLSQGGLTSISRDSHETRTRTRTKCPKTCRMMEIRITLPPPKRCPPRKFRIKVAIHNIILTKWTDQISAAWRQQRRFLLYLCHVCHITDQTITAMCIYLHTLHNLLICLYTSILHPINSTL